MPLHPLADGQSLYYELTGTGPHTLVLLNGLTMTTAAWGWHVPLYAQQFRVLTLDLRGQGQSSKPETDAYSLDQQADDVASLIAALGLGPVRLLGLSYGGMVAQHLAHRHPASVERLVLASTLAYSDAANAAIAASWAAAEQAGGADLRFTDSLPWIFGSQFLATQQPMLDAMRALAGQFPWAPIARLSAGVLAHDARPWLGDIRIPSLVLVGSEDRLTPRYQADALLAGLADARLEVLPGAGHASHLEALPQFVALTSQFLAG